MVEAAFLLFSLNEALSRTALLVQPLHLPEGTPPDGSLRFADIPLPLPPERESHVGGVAALTCATLDNPSFSGVKTLSGSSVAAALTCAPLHPLLSRVSVPFQVLFGS